MTGIELTNQVRDQLLGDQTIDSIIDTLQRGYGEGAELRYISIDCRTGRVTIMYTPKEVASEPVRNPGA
jgi:hypothetical protein